jgi:hypothetical protein
MSIFYQTITDMVLPLLLFGILFALLQFSINQIGNQRQTRLGRILSVLSVTQGVWFFLLCSLGLYIVFKLINTFIGWALTSPITTRITSDITNYMFGHNITEICGQPIPTSIDYQMGIGAGIILVALLISIVLIIKHLLNHRRSRKTDWF